MCNALGIVASCFKEYNIPWVLIGTASLSLQNVAIEPVDIDILTTAEAAYRAGDALKEYKEIPVSYGTTEFFRSYRGVYTIDGVKVEVMGDFEERVGEEWIPLSERLSSPIMIPLGSMEIPVSSLQDQLVSYQRLGRKEDRVKIDAIKRALLEKES